MKGESYMTNINFPSGGSLTLQPVGTAEMAAVEGGFIDLIIEAFAAGVASPAAPVVITVGIIVLFVAAATYLAGMWHF